MRVFSESRRRLADLLSVDRVQRDFHRRRPAFSMVRSAGAGAVRRWSALGTARRVIRRAVAAALNQRANHRLRAVRSHGDAAVGAASRGADAALGVAAALPDGGRASRRLDLATARKRAPLGKVCIPNWPRSLRSPRRVRFPIRSGAAARRRALRSRRRRIYTERPAPRIGQIRSNIPRICRTF